MTIAIVLQFVVVLAAIWMGAPVERAGPTREAAVGLVTGWRAVR